MSGGKNRHAQELGRRGARARHALRGLQAASPSTRKRVAAAGVAARVAARKEKSKSYLAAPD
jgi:hypothetical protein